MEVGDLPPGKIVVGAGKEKSEGTIAMGEQGCLLLSISLVEFAVGVSSKKEV